MSQAPIRPCGEAALLVWLGETGRVHALARALRSGRPQGVIGLVPGIVELLVEFDPLLTDAETVGRATHAALESVRTDQAPPGRHRSIPVAYGGELGPDLDEVARLTRLAPDEVARRHAASKLTVTISGFAAGFAYLDGLPAELEVPRLATPRTRTAAGSVAIAGRMSGIYPADLPGGWLVIGRTPLTLFDPAREPPAYLVPGDTVRFEPIDVGDFDRLAGAAPDW